MAKQQKKKELDPVNVHDQQLMIDLGLHPKNRVICDFSKTAEEKRELKNFVVEREEDFTTKSGLLGKSQSFLFTVN